MHPRIRSLATNLALALGSGLVVLAATELALRAFPRLLPPESQVRVHWMRTALPVTREDPETGFLYPTHFEGQSGSGEATFRYRTDEHGFRNPTPWPDSAEIVIVGDSEAFGFGVDDDRTWTHLLAGALPRSRVVNVGLPGTAPQQYLRIYERYGATLHPRLLLFGLFPGNDLGDQREFDAWQEAGSPGNYSTWKFVRGDPPGPVRTLLERTYVYWLFHETLGRLSWPSTKSMTFPDGSRIRFAPSLFRGHEAMARPDHPVFQRVLGIVEEARALAAENGTHFLVLLFPTKEGVYLPLRGEEPPRLVPPFVTAFEERGMPYLDLTLPMQEVARGNKRLFFEVDGHPDSVGYRVIADAVLSHLQQNAGAYDLADWQ